MTRNYTLEIVDDIVIVRFTRKPDLEDFEDAVDEIALNHLHRMRLWDLSSHGVNLSNTQLEQLAIHAQKKLPLPAKAAVVAPDDLGFGLSRVYDVFREQDQLKSGVFRTAQEALTWLKDQTA